MLMYPEISPCQLQQWHLPSFELLCRCAVYFTTIFNLAKKIPAESASPGSGSDAVQEEGKQPVKVTKHPSLGNTVSSLKRHRELTPSLPRGRATAGHGCSILSPKAHASVISINLLRDAWLHCRCWKQRQALPCRPASATWASNWQWQWGIPVRPSQSSPSSQSSWRPACRGAWHLLSLRQKA